MAPPVVGQEKCANKNKEKVAVPGIGPGTSLLIFVLSARIVNAYESQELWNGFADRRIQPHSTKNIGNIIECNHFEFSLNLVKYSFFFYVRFNAWSKLKWQLANIDKHLLNNVKCCPFA